MSKDGSFTTEMTPLPPDAPSLREALERLLAALAEYERAWMTTYTGYNAVSAAKAEARAALAAAPVAAGQDYQRGYEAGFVAGVTGQSLAPAAAPPATGGLDVERLAATTGERVGRALAQREGLLDVERLARALKALSLGPGYPVWREKPDKGNPSVVTVTPDHKATAKRLAAAYAAAGGEADE